MTETLYGPWFVLCEQLNWDFGMRFIIKGSDSSDGIYPAVPGTVIPRVSGQEWSIEIEWSIDEDRLVWHPSPTRSSASYTISEGLVIRIGASDDYEVVHDTDYMNMVLVCKSLDQTINPKLPPDTSFNFTISPNMLR